MKVSEASFASDRRRWRPRKAHVGGVLLAAGLPVAGIGAWGYGRTLGAEVDALVRAPLGDPVVTLDGPATYGIHVESPVLFTTSTREVGSGDDRRTEIVTECRQPECDRLLAAPVEVTGPDGPAEVHDVGGEDFYQGPDDRNGLAIASVDVPAKGEYRIDIGTDLRVGNIAVGDFPSADGGATAAVAGGVAAMAAGGGVIGWDRRGRRRRLP